MKFTLIKFALLAVVPAILSSCATKTGSAVAGAAAYKSIEDKKDEEKKEDYIKYKALQNASR